MSTGRAKSDRSPGAGFSQLDRVAIVTGAGSGIGLEIAQTLARGGARVVVSDIDEGAAGRGAEQIRAERGQALSFCCDVADELQVRGCVEAALQTYGALEILVNCAGFQHVAPIEEFPTETFERMLRVMVTGPFLGMKYAIPAMKSRGWGRILTVASINGLVGFAGKAGYNSAKHAVIGLTRVAALELADRRITVNALCPGYVDTPLVRGQLEALGQARGVPPERALEEVILPMVPQRRLLSTHEVADYAQFLVSEAAAGVTGQAIVLDGGYTAQ